jgi:predicted N-acetyltransferase YhbS
VLLLSSGYTTVKLCGIDSFNHIRATLGLKPVSQGGLHPLLDQGGAEGGRTSMIRSATVTDSDAIKELIQSVSGTWPDGWRADAVERSIQSADDLAFVAEADGEIVGFVCAHDLGFRAYLSELVVRPSCQQQGIGTDLLAQVEQRLAEHDCRTLVADVWREAKAFYKQQGWAPPDAVLLRRTICAPLP